LVFKKIRAVLGGKLKLIITGSTMCSSDIIEFLRIVLSCEILEGYGTIETMITCFCSYPGDKKTGHVGGPLPGIYAKLKKCLN
jgi:Long-chain acyl-CoA synthetases (AMP-forming)